MNAETWLHVFQEEYLSRFIPAGGSCVKVIIGEPSLLQGSLHSGLAALAAKEQFRYFPLDAAKTKLHLIDKLFHAIASRIDWPAQAVRFLETQLREAGYRLDPIESRVELARTAAQNGLTEGALAKDLQALLKRHIIDDLDMSIEFRYAALHLCLARIYRNGTPLSDLEAPIVSWLSGDLSSIVALRKASIFQRIGRHNGRHLLYSLATWMRKCNFAGMIVTLDISRYLEVVKTIDRREGYYYTPANTSDLYEILRECVDDIDKAMGIVVLVLAPPAFLNDDRRGINVYQALKMRIWDDVRVRGHENPVAPLVRLAAGEALSVN